MIYKLYNDETLKVLIPQGSSPQFVGVFKKEYQDEWESNPSTLSLSCGCTSMSIDYENETITFKVHSPEFKTQLSQPYLKSVTSTFRSKKTDVNITWDIKFNVKP